jgi:hypothetical protein
LFRITASGRDSDGSAFWTFSGFRHHIEQRYSRSASTARSFLDAVETEAFARQAEAEAKALNLLVANKDRAQALTLLAAFSQEAYASAIDQMRRLISDEH